MKNFESRVVKLEKKLHRSSPEMVRVLGVSVPLLSREEGLERELTILSYDELVRVVFGVSNTGTPIRQVMTHHFITPDMWNNYVEMVERISQRIPEDDDEVKQISDRILAVIK